MTKFFVPYDEIFSEFPVHSCNICMNDLTDKYVCIGLRVSAYIAVKSRVHMLQLLCNTFIAIVTTLVS